MTEKRIEICTMRAGDIKHGFGNPRRITKQKLEELETSIKEHGDFGIFLIDEHDNIIGGNQRLKATIHLYGEDVHVDCKRLIGYTQEELRYVNIKDNTHSGEWDIEALANWTADLNMDLGIKESVGDNSRKHDIKEMELLPFEKYNYVVLVCKTNIDYDLLVTKLGIKDKKCILGGKRAISARAVWYHDVEKLLFGGKKNE